MLNTDQVPGSIARCLWSYDISELDFDRDKALVITQVLNYGDWQAVKWLYEKYSEEDLKQVVKKPRRGFWFKRTLNFWLTIFQIDLSPEEFNRATFR